MLPYCHKEVLKILYLVLDALRRNNSIAAHCHLTDALVLVLNEQAYCYGTDKVCASMLQFLRTLMQTCTSEAIPILQQVLDEHSAIPESSHPEPNGLPDYFERQYRAKNQSQTDSEED